MKKKVSEQTTKVIRVKNADKTFRRFFFTGVVALGIISAVTTVQYCFNEPVKIENISKPQESKPNNHRADPELLKLTKEELDKRLLKAADGGDLEQVELLIDSGADIDARNSLGWTPLMLSAGDIDSDKTAKFLIMHGADVNAKNKYGLTPLMIAARSGRITIIESLLEYGADIDAQDYRGETAVDKALAMEFKKTADIIADYEIQNQ